MKIAIIGNGPSRNLYHKTDHDIVVGCNYPDETIDIDYQVFADCAAARLLRKGQSKYHTLGRAKLVFGERCANGLKTIKAEPGSIETLFQFLMDKCDVSIVKYPKIYRNIDEQHWVSAGHLAYIHFVKQYPNANFDFYGFDSLFTGDSNPSYSNIDVRKWDNPYLERNILIDDEKTPTTEKWIQCWETLLDKYYKNDTKLTFHGMIGDRKLPQEISKFPSIQEELH